MRPVGLHLCTGKGKLKDSKQPRQQQLPIKKKNWSPNTRHLSFWEKTSSLSISNTCFFLQVIPEFLGSFPGHSLKQVFMIQSLCGVVRVIRWPRIKKNLHDTRAFWCWLYFSNITFAQKLTWIRVSAKQTLEYLDNYTRFVWDHT